MKSYLMGAAFLVGAITFSSCRPARFAASRPSNKIYTRPVAPGPGYVWINGDWYWRGGGYQWREGRWGMARPGRSWHDGSWVQTRRGWKWNRGRWR